MQQNQNQFVYNFKSLINNRHNRSIQAFALVDDIVTNVTPDNFTTGFERVLNAYGGAVIIISRKTNSKNIIDALRTYEDRSSANFIENLQNDENEIEWIYHSRTNNTFSETCKFKMIVKGQLLVISGVFPDIYINVRRLFNDNLITTGKQYPLIMIQIINILLQYTLLGIDTIKNDLVETLIKKENLVLINSCQFTLYFNSRKRLIEEQKNILSSIIGVLGILESNIKVLGASTAVADRITTIRRKVIRSETDMGFMDGHLRKIQENMSCNRGKFLSAIKWFGTAVIGVITYTIVGIYHYARDSHNIDKRNAVTGRCIGGSITIIMAFLLVKYLGGWKIKWKKY